MSQEQEFYRKNGYIVVPNLFEPIRGVMAARLRMASLVSVDALRAECRLISRKVEILGLFASNNVCGVAQSICGIGEPIAQTNPVCHAMGFDESYDGVGPHQDWPALQSSLNAVTVWIPLDNVDEDDYPVEVVPGSHMLGLLPAKAGAHYSEIDAAGVEFVPVYVPRGGALFFSVFTIHRTRTPGIRPRVAFSHRYEDGACDWFVEQGYPSAQSRVIDRKIRVIPSMEHVRRAFL